MPTKNILFVLFACFCLAHAKAIPFPDPFAQCEGRAKSACKLVNRAGVEIDGICERSTVVKVSRHLRTDETCLQNLIYCDVTPKILGKTG
jgi:hypothetical protein